MKKMQSVLFASFVLILILACNRNSKTFEIGLNRNFAMDSVAVADQPESTLPERRFIRSASLKSKVHSVTDAVSEIETRTRALGGYVSYSHLANDIQDSSAVEV